MKDRVCLVLAGRPLCGRVEVAASTQSPKDATCPICRDQFGEIALSRVFKLEAEVIQLRRDLRDVDLMRQMANRG